VSLINKADPLFKITKARGILISQQPFFGTLALRLKLQAIDDPNICPVMATDGKTLFYNPAAVKAMPQQQVLGVVAHEVSHCAFQHMFRKRHRDHRKWNKATDYVINSILLKERFSLPEGRLFHSKYADMSAEEVYSKLPNDPPGSGSGSGADGWDFGSCLDPDAPDPVTGEKPTPASVRENEKAWEIAVKQAAHIAKSVGKLPGSLSSLVEELFAPQIPWREHLWRFMNKRKPERVTWSRPDRRLLHDDIIIPSKRYVPTGDIVVGIDTSGSISEDELVQFASELQEIHKAIKPTKLWVLNIDTAIHKIDEYGPYDKLKIEYFGRGGTRFDPLFTWLDANRDVQPDAVVYLTDGYADWPTQYFNAPVLWCMTNDEITPPWGECVRLTNIGEQ
jgi:predicted metal-dependent peptidase